MSSNDREWCRPGPSATAAGVNHVRLWYHYLDIGDLDAYGSLLDEHARISRPEAPPGHGREQIVELQAELTAKSAEHHIYKIVAVQDTVAVMGRYTAPADRADAHDPVHVEFADFFTLTDKGMLLSCRRYYYVAPEPPGS